MSSPFANRAVLGLDIGGANLKVGHTAGRCRHHRFSLWKNPSGLADALRDALDGAPPYEKVAVTMTGELCDCYESKRQGVSAILDAVEAVVTAPLRVWTNEGTFTDPARARAGPLKVASANWLALATIAGRIAPSGPALLIDVGTTTTDIVPLLDGRPVPQGRTDPERLKSNELVYRGWRRTPLCALLGDGAAELFATTHDVYLVMKAVAEDPADCDTADGRPATRAAAHRRLARMLCADLESSTQRECEDLARMANLRLVYSIASAAQHVAERLPGPVRTVIAAGSGEFIVPMVLAYDTINKLCDAPPISLEEQLGEGTSASACASAVAVLCSEEEG
jgi:probable H4MPT-linked C1 transfer pathway protein